MEITLSILRPKVVHLKKGVFIMMDTFKNLWYSVITMDMFLVMHSLYFAYYYPTLSSVYFAVLANVKRISSLF